MNRRGVNPFALSFLLLVATAQAFAAAPMQDTYGEPSDGLAVMLKPLLKDELAPFAFEVTARNAGSGSLILAGAKEPQNWVFEFETIGPAGPSGTPMDGCLVFRTFSTPGPVDMRLQPRQTDALHIRYDMGFCNFDNRRVPLSAMAPGKYRVRAVFSGSGQALASTREKTFQGRAISNPVDIELQAPEDRTPRRSGFGLPTNNLSARIVPTFGSRGEINFEITLMREGANASPAVIREFAPTAWKFKFFHPNGDVIVVHAKKPVDPHELRIAPQDSATLRIKCDESWIFERNSFEIPSTRLDPAKYRIVAELTIPGSRDLNNIKHSDNFWTGTLTSNVVRFDIDPNSR